MARGNGLLSATVRPAFGAAPAWSRARHGAPAIARKVHVAYLEKPFEDYWAAPCQPRYGAISGAHGVIWSAPGSP
jgi:hypothetical protein